MGWKDGIYTCPHCRKAENLEYTQADLDDAVAKAVKERTRLIHRVLKQEGYGYATRIIVGLDEECFEEDTP